MCGFRDARRTQALLSCFGCDTAARRVVQTSDERGMSSRHTPGTLRRMAWSDCHFRISESYLIRITTLEQKRQSTTASLTTPRRPGAYAQSMWKRRQPHRRGCSKRISPATRWAAVADRERLSGQV